MPIPNNAHHPRLSPVPSLPTRAHDALLNQPPPNSIRDLLELPHRHAHIVLIHPPGFRGCFGEELAEGPELGELRGGEGLGAGGYEGA